MKLSAFYGKFSLPWPENSTMNTIQSHLNPFHINLWSRSRSTHWRIPLGFSEAVLVSSVPTTACPFKPHWFDHQTYLIKSTHYQVPHCMKFTQSCNNIISYDSKCCAQRLVLSLRGHNSRPLQSKIPVFYIFVCTTLSTRLQEDTILNQMK